MSQDRLRTLQLGLTETSRLLLPFAVIWLLGAIGAGWLVKSLLILLGLLFITPLLAFLGFRWWLKRNLIQAECPVCRYEFVGISKAACHCPSCGESLTAENGHFSRSVPPGTIDVSAVEVPAQRIEEN